MQNIPQQQIQVQIAPHEVTNAIHKITGKELGMLEKNMVELILLTQMGVNVVMAEKQQTAAILNQIKK